MTMAYWPSLAGGMLLGLAAALLLLLNGRVAGISGIAGRLLSGRDVATNGAFLLGLLAGPFAYALAFGGFPSINAAEPWPVIVVAGLIVGFGVRMGSGCTSGHGILGLARLSRRSIVATGTFLLAGIATATLMGLVR